MDLKNKNILITAGPTWVPIDSVRVISNIATGQTGIMLAEKLRRLGAKVTLLLGSSEVNCSDRRIRVLRFKFFNELRESIKKELKNRHYDVIIHSAAVSDFKPGKFIKGKIKSGKEYHLKLKPLPKIINDIRRFAPATKVAMFKLEPGVSKEVLLQRAKAAQAEAGTDFVVANRINPYQAFIINEKNDIIPVKSKSELVKKLLRILLVTKI